MCYTIFVAMQKKGEISSKFGSVRFNAFLAEIYWILFILAP